MENQATATVDNPYGLQALWASGDMIARSVLILLAIMSPGLLVRDPHEALGPAQAEAVCPGCREAVLDRSFNQGRRRAPQEGRRLPPGCRGRPACGFRTMTACLTDRIDLHEWITMSLQARCGPE